MTIQLEPLSLDQVQAQITLLSVISADIQEHRDASLRARDAVLADPQIGHKRRERELHYLEAQQLTLAGVCQELGAVRRILQNHLASRHNSGEQSPVTFAEFERWCIDSLQSYRNASGEPASPEDTQYWLGVFRALFASFRKSLAPTS
ncbi:hypothetical protein [Aureliella helgolandensis]|uniref:Uncharacterized protein n=1 Tax=Aureliella helgolandensis TaxID=2527968 RepID=A0A518G2R9_9BACT|nr:hypothetical protein [Aureliella helgolandensis]QDV22884.1 hypothetical protein Q31a_11770 [Aureliella helgolandensis]